MWISILFAETDEGAKPDDAGGYHYVAFSYGKTEDSADQKNSDDGQGNLGFRPPFPVPESLLQNLVSKCFSIFFALSVVLAPHLYSVVDLLSILTPCGEMMIV